MPRLALVVVVATIQLWSLEGTQSPCSVHLVRTGKVFDIAQQVPGDRLYFSYATTALIRHPCNKKVALYLGRHLFLTQDSFEGSLIPFTIPASMAVGVPEVTSAHFSGQLLLLVVNHKVYLYNYKENTWKKSAGIKRSVSHLHLDSCCFEGKTFCVEINNDVIAYMRGELLSKTGIYFSSNGGISFQDYIFPRQKAMVGSLGGIFYFHSLSQISMLITHNGKGIFAYSDHPLNRSFGPKFDYNETLEILLTPGLRGFLILWNQTTLLVSPNAGQLIETVRLQEGEVVRATSVIDANVTIRNIAINENELAFLTLDNKLYYGSQGYLKTSVVKLWENTTWSQDAAMVFVSSGVLDILTPIPDTQFLAFDFQRCRVNIQTILMSSAFEVNKCNVELLEGHLDDQIYTIDMNSNLQLAAHMVPRQGKNPVPLVMVSNPHSLGLEATASESGTTLDGNVKIKLDIKLKQQHHWGRTDPNFTSSIKRSTISAVTVDVANKPISCIDLKPLSALISVGCDLKKKIMVQNKISACTRGLLDPVELQRNYTYVVEKKFYRTKINGPNAIQDLLVFYPYKELGCPRLVYYDSPWKPVIELWRDEEMQELVDVEFVLLETNGLFSYSYSLTAETAECVSQPQNWTTILASAQPGTQVWNRENYVSCHKPSKDNPLRWPDVQYEILGGPTDNQIIFGQRNGIYIFLLSIVDPSFSYCHLETTFSIYVFGAYPELFFPGELTMMLLVLGTLLSIWLSYFIPKQLGTEGGQRFKESCHTLCRRTMRICSCRWVWRWMRSRKVQGGT